MFKSLMLLGMASVLCLVSAKGYGQGTSITAQYINTIPQADQFTGTGANDACNKLVAAITYAVGNGIHFVDATHFTGTQACSVNPFAGLTGYADLHIEFGSALWQTAVPWVISASGISLQGHGVANTQIEYVGSGSVAEVVEFINAEHEYMDGFFVFGGPVTVPSPQSPAGAVTTAFYIQEVHRSHFSRISVWGASTGWSIAGAVTNTYVDPHASIDDATYLLPNFTTAGYAYTVPSTGFYWSSGPSDFATNSSITDILAEGMSGWGIIVNAAQNLTFYNGTSEGNGAPGCTSGNCGGIEVNAAGKLNTFIGMDMEENGVFSAGVFHNGYQGSDVYDQGQSNFYINGIYNSPNCTGVGCGPTVFATGSENGQWIFGDAGPISGFGGLFDVLGNNPNFQGYPGLTSLWRATSVSLSVPIITSNSPAPSFYPGAGITSVSCGDESGQAPGCTSARGTIKVVNSSATATEAFAEIIFGSALPSKPSCTFTQAGGTSTFLGLFPSGVATTAFYIANTASLAGLTTFYVSYVCTL